MRTDIHIVKKARGDVGACINCKSEIKAGEPYSRTDWQANKEHMTCWCQKCKVDLSQIPAKRTATKAAPKTEAEIQEKVDKVIEQTADIASKTATKTKPEKPDKNEVKGLVVSDSEKSVYCSKCQCNHVIGSRRYRQHKLYLEEGKQS